MRSFETRPSRFKTRGDDHRGTTLRFHLTRRGLVRFTVFQISPSCKRVGDFVRQGRRGENEVEYGGRVNGRPLPPGTYRIVAKPVGRARGATVSDRFVVVAPSDSVSSAHAAPSTCGGGTGADGTPGGSDSDGALLAAVGGGDDPGERNAPPESGGGEASEASNEEGGVAQFRESVPGPVDEGAEGPFWLFLVFLSAMAGLLVFLALEGIRALRSRHNSSA